MAKHAIHLSLYIPHLLTPGPTADQLKQIDLPELSALSLVLSRAKTQSIPKQDFFERSFSLFGQLPDDERLESSGTPHSELPDSDLPIGPIAFSALENSKEQSGSKKWIYKVTPVYLHPDMDQLVLSEDLSQLVDEPEAQQICQSINDYFNESEQDKSWELQYYGKEHFYLISQWQIRMSTTPLAKVLGLPITHHLPKGEEASYWNQTLNEIQMFLFSMPLNQKRKEQGKTAINSLWLWGGGEHPIIVKTAQEKQICSDWEMVCSNNQMIKHFCQFLKIPHQKAEQSHFETLLNTQFDTGPDTANKSKNGHQQLIVLDELQHAYTGRDFYVWLEGLKEFENTLFKPLVQALKEQKIETLRILTEGEQMFSINKRQLNAWWKRKQPFDKFLK